MKRRIIEVPVVPGDFIYYPCNKYGIIKYKVASIILNQKGMFIEIDGNYDSGEEVVFSIGQIGKDIFLDEDEANESIRSK